MTFNAIRAFSIRPGDKIPAPLAWGGWNKSRAIEVSGIDKKEGMIVINLVGGESIRAISTNLIPFIR